MIILDNVVVTDEFLNAQFCCCLPRCKGWCCVAGDAGAPLEASEIEQTGAVWPAMLAHHSKPLK